MQYNKCSIILLSCLFLQGFSSIGLSSPSAKDTYVAQDALLSPTMHSYKKDPVFCSSSVKGLSGFSKTKFVRKQKKIRQDAHIANQIKKAKLPSKQEQKNLLDDEKRISFSGASKEQIHNSAITTKGKLYGTKGILDKEENESTQLNVKYKNTKDTSMHVAINSQDQSSPLYSPLKKEEGLNATGIYVETELSESTKALVGGEIRTPDALSNSSDNNTSQGVSVKLSWSF